MITKKVEIPPLNGMKILAIFAFSLIGWDIGTIYLSLPSISLDLQVTTEMKWVILSFFLPLIGLPFIVRHGGEGLKTRKIALMGVSLFTIGSALCGVALLNWQLVIYRWIQGIGGLLLIASFARNITFRQIGITGFLSGGVGLLLGGILLNLWSWHLLFLLNALLGLVLYYLCLWKLPLEERSIQVMRSGLRAIVPIFSIILLATGFSPYGEIGGIPTIFFLLTGLGLILFWYVKEKKTLQLKKQTFLLLTEAFCAFIASSLVFLIPFYFTKELEFDSFSMGFLFLLLLMIFLIARNIRKRVFAHRSVYFQMLIRSALLLVGLILILPLHPSWNWMDLVIRLSILSVGYGFSAISVHKHCFSLYACWMIGWVMGPILCTLIWTPNMVETLPNLIDMRIILYMLILFVLLSLLGAIGLLMGMRVVNRQEEA